MTELKKPKLILVDCDGVLLDWESSFHEWMDSEGYKIVPDCDVNAYSLHFHYGLSKKKIRELIVKFNSSAAIATLKPFRDSVEFVTKLSNEGYSFCVITSLSTDKYAISAREANLKLVFPTVDFEVICLDTGSDKDEALLPYKNSGLFFIEDKTENAQTGNRLGLTSLLIRHTHNENVKDIPILDNWREIYEYINGNGTCKEAVCSI